MPKLILFYLLLLIIPAAKAQNCDNLFVDIDKGTLNDLSVTTSPDEVKKKFPCFTGQTKDGSAENCGGGVFYSRHNFYFYTGKDNINIRKGFTGKCSIEIFGKTDAQLIELFGKPEGEIKDDEGARYLYFKRSYGCIVIEIKAGKAEEFFMYGLPADEIDLCV